jgi:septal ring factor EnvC (AmiA/AmiB activator)
MTPESIKYFLLIILTLLVLKDSLAQKTKEQLQIEKQAALQKLNEARKILEETEKEKLNSLGQLSAINHQIELSESLIHTIRGEISILDNEMEELSAIILSLESDLQKLKTQYGTMAYHAYTSSFGLRDLTFLFSASTFSQLVLRMRYMEQYASERKKQLVLIQQVRESLITQKTVLVERKTEKQSLLEQELSQNQNLTSLKSRQSQLITALGKKEKELRAELEERKRSIAQLDKLIADVIAAEIRESSKGKSNDRVALSGNMASISRTFETSVNKLPWPVNAGFISSRFGTHPHPVYKRLTVPNDGIDIQTNSNETVKAVFDGEVKQVAFVPGDMKYVVLIQHGEYFTVYAKLKDVSVKKGQIVKSNDAIGVVSTNKEGVSEVQFQIWKNYQKLNPETWIVKK